MPLTRLTALDGEAVLPLEEAKASQRILHTKEDDELATYRDAAVLHVERVSGVVLAPATFLWTLRRFPASIDLPAGPVTELTSVKYHDADGEEQTYTGARLVGGAVYPGVNGSWPTAHDYVAVEFKAGVAEPKGIEPLIQAAKLLFGHYVKHREAVVLGPTEVNELPLGVQALIDTYRVLRV